MVKLLEYCRIIEMLWDYRDIVELPVHGRLLKHNE